MEEVLIGIEVAKLAKECGFSPWLRHKSVFVEKFIVDGEEYLKPSQAVLAKWLREEKEIDVLINRGSVFADSYCIFIYDNINDTPRLRPLNNNVFSGYKTYEEILERGLLESLTLIR